MKRNFAELHSATIFTFTAIIYDKIQFMKPKIVMFYIE